MMYAIAVNRRRIYFAGGLLLTLAAAILLMANIDSGQIGSILAIAGVALGLLPIFLRYPLLPVQKAPAEPAGQAAGQPVEPGDSNREAKAMPQRGMAVPSRVYGVALFLAAPLLFITSIRGLEGTSTSKADITYHLLALATGILAPIGFAGFNLRHTSNARRFGIAATVFVVTNWILNDAANFTYLACFNSGKDVPVSVFTLFRYDATAAVIANIFLAAAISLGRYYPQWIAWMCLANGTAEAFYFFNTSNPAVLDINMVGDLVLSVAYIAIGYYMLKRPPAFESSNDKPRAQLSVSRAVPDGRR